MRYDFFTEKCANFLLLYTHTTTTESMFENRLTWVWYQNMTRFWLGFSVIFPYFEIDDNCCSIFTHTSRRSLSDKTLWSCHCMIIVVKCGSKIVSCQIASHTRSFLSYLMCTYNTHELYKCYLNSCWTNSSLCVTIIFVIIIKQI